MKTRILSICCLAIVSICAAYAGASAQERHSEEMGLSVSQLQDLLRALPPLPGTVQAIQFLRRDGFWVDRAAILTQGEKSGWQIFVLHLENTGRFALEWKSGRLEDSFAVSSASQFQTHNVGALEQVLEFSGCAAHNCPDVFSVMLYSPLRKTAFTAAYILGKVSYSQGLESPDSREYKDALDEFVKEHRNQ